MASRRGGRLRVTPAGRSWVRITPERTRQREAKAGPSGRVYLAPRVQKLLRGFTYHG